MGPFMAPARIAAGRSFRMSWRTGRPLVALATLASLGCMAGCTGMMDRPATRAELAAAMRNEVAASPDLLLAKFDRTIFYSDSGRNAYVPRGRLEKWAGPINAVVVGTLSDPHKQFIEAHFAELSRLTGLPITLRRGEGSVREVVASLDRHQANFLVAIDNRGGLDQLQVAMGTSAQERWINRQVVCFFYASPRRGRIVGAFSAIPNVHEDAIVRHCLIEETTQALGLYADADMIQPSMFSERTPPILGKLTLNDKIVVRTLYDPRITPNMHRDKALEVAQQVIAELLDAVRQGGVEALYQQPATPSSWALWPQAARGS